MADGTLSWDDAKAVIDLVVGTSFNKANKGDALKKIKEIVDRSKATDKVENVASNTLGVITKMSSDAKKMRENQIADLLGDSNWHQKSFKTDIAEQYSKELRGSTNFDF